ncbi:MAG TPA: hypothetical protein VMY77_00310 [Chitinophagaceae bacterium]|nr:hypothetical protein [Chitinophagaceae bacterium]
MKKLLLLSFFSFHICFSKAQIFTENQYQNLQVLEKELARAKTAEEKTNALISVYVYHAAHSAPVNIKAAKNYEQQLEIFTHQTNEPELIARGFLGLTFSTRGEEFKIRIARLYDFAKLHNLTYYKARAKIREAEYLFIYQPDLTRATQSLNEATILQKI